MRERNWPKYNRQLIQRGSLTFLIDPKFLKSKSKRGSGAGRPLEFSDTIIEMLFMVKVHFKLTYRALQGFAEAFLKKLLPNKKVPTYTLICKRVQKLGKTLPPLSSVKSDTIILDASGMKIMGEGEWKVKVHGRGRRRKWVKVHLAIDSDTQEIVSEITTTSKVGDSSVVGKLLDQLKMPIRKVLADGGYDRRKAREEIKDRNAKALIPPPKNAKYKFNDDERDKSILEILGLGGGLEAKRLWGKLTGYNRRVLVESTFSSLKRLFGDRFFSKTFERQRVESRVRCILINKMKAMAS